MGCWNATCGVTHAPIHAGDAVVQFYLTHVADSADHASGHCYSNALWSPRTIQFYGRYNDYGAVEDIPENWHTAYFLKSLETDLVDRPQGENQYHEQAVSKADLTDLDHLQELIHDSRIILKSISMARIDGPTTRLLGHMMVLRPVFDVMVEKIHGWREKSFAEVLADGVAFYQKMLDDIASIDPNDPARRWAVRRIDHKNAFSALSNEGERVDAYTIRVGIRDYKDELLEKLAEAGRPVDDPLVVDILTELAKFIVFNRNFQTLRRSWMPQAGAGSQADEHDLHRAVMQAAITCLDDKDAEWRAMNGEDEDEPEAQEVSA